MHAKNANYTKSAYARARAKAKRFCGCAAEAEDLLHDAMVVALEAGRDPLRAPADERWLAGVINNLWKMRARTESRRRQREARATNEAAAEHEDVSIGVDPSSALPGLTRAVRDVLVLACHGLTKGEICWVLEISEPTLRQRLAAARRMIGAIEADLRTEALANALRGKGSRPDAGLIRRELLRSVIAFCGIGAHDPDGHLLVLRVPHNTRSSGNNHLGTVDEAIYDRSRKD